MHRLILVVVSVVVLAACKTDNSESCDLQANANSANCIDGGGGGGPCKVTSDCADMTKPVCDTTASSGTCVQCTMASHDLCVGMTPRCEADACAACVDDNDCGGTGVCLTDGSCAAASSIIHAISMNGSVNSTTCGKSGGTDKACTFDTAIFAASTDRNIIKLDDAGPYKSTLANFQVDTDASVNLTLDARGATLGHNGDGAIFTINSNKGMTILGGTIEGAQGGGGNGIRCNSNATLAVYGTVIKTSNEAGIVGSGCTMTVVNATIRDSSKAGGGAKFAGIQATDGTTTVSRSTLASNHGGGITITGNAVFTLVGNVFLSNGDPGGTAGGVTISTTLTGRLEFNTFFDNKTQNGVGPGIQCTDSGFTAKNNIVWANTSMGSSSQVSGNCLHTYSDIGPTGAVTDATNISLPPMFNSATDLSVTASSPVKGMAAPDADLTGIAAKDIAGKPRTSRADLGAYVVPAM